MSHSPESSSTLPANDALLRARIVDAGGKQVSIISMEHSGPDTLLWVRAADGPQALVPVSLLALQPDGSYRLPFSFEPAAEKDGAVQLKFPVQQEELHVSKRMTDTGRGVRIHKTVAELEQVVDQPLRHDELVVERVPVGAVVGESDMPRMRYEGDTLVVPVLEEVLVVHKQLRLKEEVRITRHQREVHAPQTMVVRSEQVAVERFDERANRSA